ncbi:MAG: hypothetical protein ACK4VK_02090 [Aquificaceae bacterium]
MKKISLKNLLLYSFLFFLVVFLILFLTFPKFLVFDKLLLKNGIYLTAQKVDETPISIRLKGVEMYNQNSRLSRFDFLKVGLGVFRIRLEGYCGKANLVLEISPWGMVLRAKDFTCLEGMEGLSTELYIKEGIYGNLNIKGIKVQGIKLDEISFDFKGRVFTAKGKMGGINLIGDGQIVYNSKNPLRSAINGQVSGGGIRLIIGSTLERIEIKTQ